MGGVRRQGGAAERRHRGAAADEWSRVSGRPQPWLQRSRWALAGAARGASQEFGGWKRKGAPCHGGRGGARETGRRTGTCPLPRGAHVRANGHPRGNGNWHERVTFRWQRAREREGTTTNETNALYIRLHSGHVLTTWRVDLNVWVRSEKPIFSCRACRPLPLRRTAHTTPQSPLACVALGRDSLLQHRPCTFEAAVHLSFLQSPHTFLIFVDSAGPGQLRTHAARNSAARVSDLDGATWCSDRSARWRRGPRQATASAARRVVTERPRTTGQLGV